DPTGLLFNKDLRCTEAILAEDETAVVYGLAGMEVDVDGASTPAGFRGPPQRPVITAPSEEPRKVLISDDASLADAGPAAASAAGGSSVAGSPPGQTTPYSSPLHATTGTCTPPGVSATRATGAPRSAPVAASTRANIALPVRAPRTAHATPNSASREFHASEA